MAKIAEKTKGKNITVNKTGTKAYKLGDKAKLMTMVTTSFFNEAKFYGDNSNELINLAEAIAKKDPDWRPVLFHRSGILSSCFEVPCFGGFKNGAIRP